MADVIMKIKTNYFRTTDPDALNALLESAKTDGGPVRLVLRDGRAMFYCDSEITGILTDEAKKNLETDPDWADDNPDTAYSFEAFMSGLQKLVTPGDACVIKTVGYEAMRCLFADADIVTYDKIYRMDFDLMIRDKARSFLGNPAWDTEFNY